MLAYSLVVTRATIDYSSLKYSKSTHNLARSKEHPRYTSLQSRSLFCLRPQASTSLTSLRLLYVFVLTISPLLHLSCSACMPLLLYEELVLNALATLNNLSYYDEPGSYVVQKQQEITEREGQTTELAVVSF